MTSADYTLVVPRDFFKVELSSLINNKNKLNAWAERVQLFLDDSFASPTPMQDFDALPSSGDSDPWSSPPATTRRDFLVSLLRKADGLPYPAERPAYWIERRSGVAPGSSLGMDAFARQFVRILTDFERRGYLEQEFEKDCVDDPATTSPPDVLEGLTGRRHEWPPAPTELAADRDGFFDLIEAVHDLISRPRTRFAHTYSGCGWHHGDFNRSSGQAIYVWRVNRLLDRSTLGVRLSAEGEDRGRLVEMTDDARTALIHTMVQRDDESTGGRVRHAIALFQGRSATEHEKRSAAVVLALVLEERRPLLKAELLSKDEGALFHIANHFAVRHEDAKQQKDYDSAFRDWMFWWYLATIELTDRLLERSPDNMSS